MSASSYEAVQAIFDAAIGAHQRFMSNGVRDLTVAAEAITRAAASGRKVVAFGNGGSAGDAQHLAAELVGRFERERTGLPAIALTADSSIVTAIANDYGYDLVFARQVEAIGGPGDVAVGITTSGRSRNVEVALRAAQKLGMTTIALTGRDGGPVGALADIHLNVAETSTARIQEVHRTVLHAMCFLIDQSVGSE